MSPLFREIDCSSRVGGNVLLRIKITQHRAKSLRVLGKCDFGKFVKVLQTGANIVPFTAQKNILTLVIQSVNILTS